MGIPAIRESIVLHRQGLATLKEPNYLRLSLILAVVCSGLRWFACFPLFSLPIIPNSGGDLWWFAMMCGGLWSFAVVCGRFRWFAMVCGGLSYVPQVVHSNGGLRQNSPDVVFCGKHEWSSLVEMWVYRNVLLLNLQLIPPNLNLCG